MNATVTAEQRAILQDQLYTIASQSQDLIENLEATLEEQLAAIDPKIINTDINDNDTNTDINNNATQISEKEKEAARAEIKNVSKIQNMELDKYTLHHEEEDSRMSLSIHPIDVIHIY